tara:strand:- start:11476 stop:11844 length:369 start_codon:yes stop_codon:yes gene_type:complete
MLGFTAFAQNDTIHIQKVRSDIYKCQTKPALSWYIHVTNERIILVDLKIQPFEIEGWFERFGNSQNLYKSLFPENPSKTLFFQKTNEPLDTLIFEIIEFTNNRIILEIQPSKEKFEFSIFRM